MRKTFLLCTVAAAASLPAAFANKTAKTDTASTDSTATDTAAPAATKPERVAPEVTPITSDVPMPQVTSRRGSASIYDFDSLTVGASFGVKNKTAAQMRQTVSAANSKYRQPVVEGGIPQYHTKDIDTPEGKRSVPDMENPKTTKTRDFFVVDTDPATDPHGAKCRVFRKA